MGKSLLTVPPLCGEGDGWAVESSDEADRVLLYIESSSWPNFDGIDKKRIITSLSDDELKWYSAAGSIGTTADVAWKRTKQVSFRASAYHVSSSS